MGVSDFNAYRARWQRMKKLEVVLQHARSVFAAARNKSPDHVLQQALVDLRLAIEAVDLTPPPHQSDLDPA